MYTKETPLVYSTSDHIAYGRCPNSFKYSRILGYRFRPKDVMSQGTSFHVLMQNLYQGKSEEEMQALARDDEWPEMYDVFTAYRKHWHDFPRPDQVVSVEKPIYTALLENVYLRTTFDLVWNNDGEITVDDYKTFEKDMKLDVSLDTQGRLYLIAIKKAFPQYKRFKLRYRNVRRTPPFVPKNATQAKAQAAGKVFESWNVEECYRDHPLPLLAHEEETTWKEAQHRARKILFDLETKAKDPTAQVFDRVYLKGHSPYCCGNQICNVICMKEMVQGTVNEIDLITEGVTVEPSLQLPEGFLK